MQVVERPLNTSALLNHIMISVKDCRHIKARSQVHNGIYRRTITELWT